MNKLAMITTVFAATGILAISGCCGFFEMQKRAKRSEAPTNLDGIRTAEKAYHAEWDTFTAVDWTPPQIPGKKPGAFTGGGKSAFEHLGWMPPGDVYCRYRVTNVVTDETNVGNDSFLAEVECDIDGDGTVSRYTATESMKSMMETMNNVY